MTDKTVLLACCVIYVVYVYRNLIMTYGDKRDYKKIDIFVQVDGSWKYACSTTWAKTCKEAKARYFAKGGRHIDSIKCNFAKG